MAVPSVSTQGVRQGAPTLIGFAKSLVDPLLILLMLGVVTIAHGYPIRGAEVVLGLITSKFPQLEPPDEVKARIDAAARYAPLDQLCLSPQCGFSSTHHGNDLTEDEQWRKLELVVDVSRSVWG